MDTEVTLTANSQPAAALLEHIDWIQRLARRLVRDAAAAEDLTQEVLLAALRGQPRPVGLVRPWLGGIVRNLARQERRRGVLRHDRELDAALSTLREDGIRQVGHDQVVARAEAHRALVSHVLALPDPGRSLLLKRYFEGRRPVQIAQDEGTTPAAVSAALTRAHGALRKRLEEQGGSTHWLSSLAPLLIQRRAAKSAASAAASVGGGAAIGRLPWLLAGLFSVGAITTAMVISRGSGGAATAGPERADEFLVDPSSPLPEVAHADKPATGGSAGAAGRSESAARVAVGPAAESSDSASELFTDVVPEAAPPQRVSFEGRCVDEEGVPVTDVQVQLVQAIDGRPEYAGPSTLSRRVGAVFSDVNGRFQFASIEAGRYVVGVVPLKKGSTSWLSAMTVDGSLDGEIVDVPVYSGASITAKVVKERHMEDPVGIELTAFRHDVALHATGTIQADGSLQIGPLAPGTYHVSSVGDGMRACAFEPVTVEVGESLGGEPIPIRLKADRSYTVLGNVALGNGAPERSKTGWIHVGTRDRTKDNLVTWVGRGRVDRSGEYKVGGIASDGYVLQYESLDGAFVALETARLANPYSVEMAERRTGSTGERARKKIRHTIEAVPALVTWISPGRYDGRGPFAVRAEWDAIYPQRHSMGPSGSTRFVVPREKSVLSLMTESGGLLKRWKLKPKADVLEMVLTP